MSIRSSYGAHHSVMGGLVILLATTAGQAVESAQESKFQELSRRLDESIKRKDQSGDKTKPTDRDATSYFTDENGRKWTTRSPGSNITRNKALKYCSQIGQGWRVPNGEELVGILTSLKRDRQCTPKEEAMSVKNCVVTEYLPFQFKSFALNVSDSVRENGDIPVIMPFYINVGGLGPYHVLQPSNDGYSSGVLCVNP